MQVRPLRRYRMYENGKLTSRYGDQRYITQGNYFFIIKQAPGRWVVRKYGGQLHSVKEAVKDAGILNMSFRRRIDAIEALEHVMEEFE